MKSLFQDELNLLKDTAKEWVRRNPRLARFFGPQASDPDVEHLMEGFAFLTSRLRAKIEDELPEITHPLIEQVWPNFLRPFPPAAMLKFTPHGKAITGRHVLQRGMPVEATLQNGKVCSFRTTSDCAIYPFELEALRLDRTRDRCTIELDFASLSTQPLSAIKLDSLRLNFCGEAREQQALYQWMRRYLVKAFFRPSGREKGFALPPNSIVPGALGMQESLLNEVHPAFEGYRLLQEYFHFPDKFYCIDVNGLGPMSRAFSESDFSLVFEFSRPLPLNVKPTRENVRLYCCPIVNLTPATSATVTSKDQHSALSVRHRLQPVSEHSAALEIFSIDKVTSSRSAKEAKEGEPVAYAAYYSYDHAADARKRDGSVYWRHLRRNVLMSERLEHELLFVSHDNKPVLPNGSGIVAHLTCFNGDAPTTLPLGSVNVSSQKTPSFVSFGNITTPTAPVYPPLDGPLAWKLVSNLSLTINSLMSAEAFDTIVSTYDYPALARRPAEAVAAKRTQGLVSLVTKPIDWLIKGVPIRGTRSVLSVRESAFASEGQMLLYVTILSQFMAHYATTHSFHQLQVVGIEKGETVLFPPVTGKQPLI